MKENRESELLSFLHSIARSWGSGQCVVALTIRDQFNANCTSIGPFKKTPNVNTSLSWSMDLLAPRFNDNPLRNVLISEKGTWSHHMTISFLLALVPTSYFLCEKLTRDCGSNYGGVGKLSPPTLHPFIVSLVKVSVVLSRALRKSSRRDEWNPNRHVHRLCSWHQSMAAGCVVLIAGTTFFWCRECVPGRCIRLMTPFSARYSA